MNIIIAGNGKVGLTLAEHLSEEAHNVTIIDTRDLALRRASEALDVMCIKGSCTSLSVLQEANAAEADVVIAATSSDEINMLCAIAPIGWGQATQWPGSATRNISAM